MNAIEKLKESPLNHLGQRVITLGMMDEVHGRPEGTAGRAFRKHREKLSEGRHYFMQPVDVSCRPDGQRHGAEQVVLLTERGYLMVVKTFRDKLAWQVQEDLVEGYFRARAQDTDPAMEAVRQLSNVISGFVQGMLSAHERQFDATAQRITGLEQQVKQLRRGSRVSAMGRASGRDRKVRSRELKPLALGFALPGSHP